jgi:predicted HicB family RNase H-like nuclease
MIVNTNERRLNVRVSPEVHEALRKEAADRDISPQQLVEDWLCKRFGLPKLPPKSPKSEE